MDQLIPLPPTRAGTRITSPANPRYLAVEHGGAYYAIDLHDLSGLLPYQPTHAVSGMEGFLRGVTYFKDRVLPVLDLDARLGGPVATISSRSCVVVVRLTECEGAHEIGILVDAAWLVAEATPGAISPVRGRLPIREQYVSGVSRCDGRDVLVLDMQALAASEPLGD